MAKIFSEIEGLSAPKYTQFKNTKEWIEATDRYIQSIKETIHNASSNQCPDAGKIISFPVGDGKACYVVISLKPVQLVWIGNGYNYKYANRLTATDVRKEIQKAETITTLFKGK
jgi:frataxin-like iron-binding protein CyaY